MAQLQQICHVRNIRGVEPSPAKYTPSYLSTLTFVQYFKFCSYVYISGSPLFLSSSEEVAYDGPILDFLSLLLFEM